MFRRKQIDDSDEKEFRGLRRIMAITAFVIGASFCLATPQWHKLDAFYCINHLFIPWWVYGVMLLVGGIFMLFSGLKPIGFLLAALVYTIFTVATILTLVVGQGWQLFKQFHFPPASILTLYIACNTLTLAVLYWSAVRHEIFKPVYVNTELGN